ncbi:High-affinity nickel transport protein (plasmid) [Cupriavidus necator H16]|uniref:High-affinity nickel transport protein n=3 Tax=Cupriavidus necator TaxID=106590 RepID=HOXN_CUPNH|nr:HoxN/HupN/NixA family nickel/cobalt transporter [Cupriavidus necator]P23516.3 RecName: Full=High-affinity nickel transport protein [Cupriavidus necator H16]AAA69017.2 high affinity nickel transporter [Cupriavidus necator H16]AAP85779.1 high-affinity nickel permease [Cupriavidus necator H16]QCC05309.1 HoxN/HupN/NixA family nickel/cobalt transporter [Cupriavidus necator H16]QQB81481.1 HoxN/HupN/NixA family nickel/cobalt transporter [Cupriavidus necator]
MFQLLAGVRMNSTGRPRAKIILLYALLIAFNIGAWLCALAAFRDHPVLLGTALLAYGLGLRHAVDADHLAAIDNVTRKLMQDGRRPITAGLWFSLGHSSVVVLASVLIAVMATTLQERLDAFHEVGSVIGTLASALFLFAIAAINLVILRSAYRAFRRVRRGGIYVEEDFDLLFGNRGFLARIFRPLFRFITRSWHMYPLGMLFALGFDTATEVALLGISTMEASRGVPIWSILVFPALFTAGMALIDTIDSILMCGAYAWAYAKPVRKLYYNMTITFVSAIVALIVGGIETLGLLADKFMLKGVFWNAVGALNENFCQLGFVIIGIFTVCWVVSIVVYRLRRYDDSEVRA